MSFQDIFSKRKGANKPGNLGKIIIDYREKNSLIPAHLMKAGFEIEFRELKVADYIVKDVAIERKTVSDFLSSMINKRLLKQIEELQQYENKLLIIEGIEEQEIYSEKDNGINPNAVRGFLLSITLRHKIPLIFTKNSEDTANFISLIAKKQEREMPQNVRKKAHDKKEQMQFIIEGFPGIGPKTAKKLLQRFRTIKNIINASEEELKEVIGKRAEIFRLVKENY
jgi:ERCC4-type nuclease